jgi:hypothetical protein
MRNAVRLAAAKVRDRNRRSGSIGAGALAYCAAITFGVVGRRWTGPRGRLLRRTSLLGTLGSFAYFLFVRHRMMQFGATDAEPGRLGRGNICSRRKPRWYKVRSCPLRTLRLSPP